MIFSNDIRTILGDFASLVTISLGLIMVGRHLDKSNGHRTSKTQIWVGSLLSNWDEGTFADRLNNTSEAFLSIFDRLFGSRDSMVEQGIWLGLLLTPVVLISTQIPYWAEGEFIVAEDILLSAIVTSVSVSLGFLIGRVFTKSEFVIGVVAVLSITGMGLLSGLTILSDAIVIRDFYSSSAISLLFGIAAGCVIQSPNYTRIMVPLAVLLFVGMGIFLAVGIYTGSVFSPRNALAVLGGVGLATLIALALIRGLRKIEIPVHPIWALASSIVFVIFASIIVGSFQFDVLRTFFIEVADDRRVLAFVAFNIFADGVSLLETRWVLLRATKATAFQLSGLLMVDLVASTAIFMFLPLAVWEVPEFAEAIVFRGNRPWLGILFWSTFGTSALFYGFVASVMLFVIPTHALARGFRRIFGSFFKIEEHPYTFIAFAGSTTVLFITLAVVISTLIAVI